VPQRASKQETPKVARPGFSFLTIATSIVVPVTVAILGYFGKEIASAQQREIEEAKLRYSYVTLIVDILQKKSAQTDPNIVCWSWRNLSVHSKAPFTQEEIDKLCAAKAALPEDVQFGGAQTAPPSALPSNLDMWQGAKLLPDKESQVRATVEAMQANKSRYDEVVRNTNVPWYFLAILHQLESGANFNIDLHSGAALAPPANPPAANPPAGAPPATWETGARAVIETSGIKNVDFADIGKTLDFFERYNGLGYRRRGAVSPFVWGCTDQYKSGRFIGSAFSASAVSPQCGVAAYLLSMRSTGLIHAGPN
jgi:lysozyme family protein